MNPAAGVPLHFTVEALGLGVAGVVAAWAALSRRWTAAAGALLVALAQVLYAGQFFAPDDAGAFVAGVMRLAGLLLMAAGGWGSPDRPALVSGAALVAGGTIWRIATGGGPASLAAGARALTAAGFVVLAVWAWRRASVSVRSRIVAAFIGVLAVAVIVMGGAAARVSVTNAIDNMQARLESGARTEQQLIDARTTNLLNRVALGSAVVSQLGPSPATISSLRRQAFPDAETVALVRKDGTVIGGPYAPGSPPARAATGLIPRPGGIVLTAGQPVFTAPPARRDVVGVLVVGVSVTVADLASVASRIGPGVSVAIVTRDEALVRSRPSGEHFGSDFLGSRSFAAGRATRHGTEYLVSVARLNLSDTPRGAVSLAFSVPEAVAADVATSFPRALVGGVLVAALLAVVLALWLAARITRPILSLADEAERVKSDFLSTVSHELRTPLTPIRGYADLLRRGRVPRRRAEVYLDEIGDAARRLERIVTLLVEVAAMEAGRFTPELEPVTPGELLSAAAEKWQGRSRRHNVAVRSPKSLPRVKADQRSISTVLDELLDNAVKFSPNGGSIELRARKLADGVELAVADEGIGLEPEALQQLTAAFVQGEPGETRRFGGVGLGLTYAAGVLAAHGSHLALQSSPGAGTTFSFTLPTVGMVSRMSGHARNGDVTK